MGRLPLVVGVVLALVPPCAHGWVVFAGGETATPDLTNVTTAMMSTYRFSFRPGQPIIKWALSPDFCSALHPLLIEEQSTTFFLNERWQNFTRCERIHGLLRDAFNVWSSANPALHFQDVTGRCVAERLWVPIDPMKCAESDYCFAAENDTDWKVETTPFENSNPPASECSYRTCFDCPRADVVIHGFTQKNRRLGDQHAKGRVTRDPLTDARPLGPDGIPALGRTMKRATVEFNVDDEYKNTADDLNCFNGQNCNETLPNCWRLDNDVCDFVIALPYGIHPQEVNSAILIIFWCVFSALICGCLFIVLGLLQRLAANLLTGWDVDQDGKLELQEIVYVIDEFCGEVCFECRCPTVHQKKMSPLAGALSVVETVSQTAVIVPIMLIAAMTGLGVLYVDAVMPCYRCRDFRATAVHEIGHLLGLDHPTGSNGAIPLMYDLRPPAPHPPPPAAPPVFAELVQPPDYGPTDSNWSAFEFQCHAPWEGVIIDPVATMLLNPPPPPEPPPMTPPPPLIPNATWPPPPYMPPPAPPNTTVNSTFEIDLASEENITDASHLNRMGFWMDLNDTVMRSFGSTGFERPIAGIPRRCLDQDDLDGINFLFPSCGTQLQVPTCTYVQPGASLVGLRLIETWIKMMLIPLAIIVGAKLLSLGALAFEDFFASWSVRRKANKLLKDAARAEKEATAEAEGRSPSRSPTKRNMLSRLPTFKRATSTKDTPAGTVLVEPTRMNGPPGDAGATPE